MDIQYILLAAATMRMLTILREIITPVTGKPDRKLTRSQLILFLLAWGTICGYGIWLLAYRTPQPLFSRPPNFIETHEEVANHNLAEKKVETRLTRALPLLLRFVGLLLRGIPRHGSRRGICHTRC